MSILRSRLYPLERKTGSHNCKYHCYLNFKNVQERDTFSSYVTKVLKLIIILSALANY